MAKMIRVCYVIAGLQLGGAERALQKLVTNLPKSVKPIIVTLFDLPDQIIEKELKDYRIIKLHIKSVFDLPKAIAKLRSIIKKNRVQIVHSFMFHANMISRFARFRTHAKLINSIRLKVIDKTYRNYIEKATDFLVDIYTPNSETIRSFMIEKGFKKEKITVIKNAVKTDYLKLSDTEKRNLKKELGILKPWPVVCSEANLRAQKDVATTIKAVAEIVNHKKVYYLHIGSGNKYENLESELHQISENLGIEQHVKFLGFRTDTEKLLQITNIWTFSTLFEGQSNSLLQAMAHSLPIVCTDIDENKELVGNGTEALLFKPKDYKRQAQHILHLIQEKEFAKMLGANARKKVIKYHNIQNNVKKTLLLYEKLIA